MDNKLIEQAIASINAGLKPKGPYENVAVGIDRVGTKIILPNDPAEMSYDDAINVLQRKKKEEETEVSVYEIIQGAFPFDGAFAFMQAMKEIYGWAQAIPTPGFFGDIPPKTISVDIGVGKTAQLIWGDFAIPGIKGVLSTGIHQDGRKVMFKIGGKVLKKHQKDVQRVADLTRQLVKERSIYRGQVLRLECAADGKVNLADAPKFVDVSKVNKDELVFSKEVMAQIDTYIFTPVRATEQCRKYGVPLKRGILLEGSYGTGKTLTAFCTAQLCSENGWTFILLDKVSGLKEALEFARAYQPAVVFAEDIDRAVTGERSVAMDDILNTIDGIESKGTEIITILTSNHVENINIAMLRPGRLDAVISTHAPDAEAAKKLISIYARGMIEDNTDLTEAGVELAGKIPAVIREAVERAKLYAIARNPNAESIKISGQDLVFAAVGMKNHLALLNPKKDDVTLEKKFTAAFQEVMQEGIKGNGFYHKMEEISKTVDDISDRLN